MKRGVFFEPGDDALIRRDVPYDYVCMTLDRFFLFEVDDELREETEADVNEYEKYMKLKEAGNTTDDDPPFDVDLIELFLKTPFERLYLSSQIALKRAGVTPDDFNSYADLVRLAHRWYLKTGNPYGRIFASGDLSRWRRLAEICTIIHDRR